MSGPTENRQHIGSRTPTFLVPYQSEINVG
jgi:hypothetical protein